MFRDLFVVYNRPTRIISYISEVPIHFIGCYYEKVVVKESTYITINQTTTIIQYTVINLRQDLFLAVD